MGATLNSAAQTRSIRARRFMQKPWREKRVSLYSRWVGTFPSLPLPLRLPNGAWWLVRNDICSAAILAGRFENEEEAFISNSLREGMTFFDVGAHHGYYTLLASKKVGVSGTVVAFEPSQRELQSLKRHVRLNRCRNVATENLALGSMPGTAQLFVVDGGETGCNSLRPPDVSQPTSIQSVATDSLDEYTNRRAIREIDFIKLDAEGGELEILRGAKHLLATVRRPIILAEVQDVRTRPWRYHAREIISFLAERGFRWFRILPDAALETLAVDSEHYDGNFVAAPEERLHELIPSRSLSKNT